MTIDIREIKQDAFPSYSAVSPEYMVESEFECIPADGGLGGILLRERKLSQAYPKYQDDDGPAEWSREFDTNTWGFFLASDGNTPVGAAAVATPSCGMVAAGGRNDIAVLWDIRVHENHRRHSLGTQLFRRGALWARGHGFGVLGIETQNVNVPACRFYARHACELVEIRRTGYSGCRAVAHEAMLIWHLKL